MEAVAGAEGSSVDRAPATVTRIMVIPLGDVPALTRERVATVDMGGAPLEFVSGDRPGEVSLGPTTFTSDAWIGICHDIDARNPTWWDELVTALRGLSAQIVIDNEHSEQVITLDSAGNSAGLVVTDDPAA